jgi:alpha-L-fucosidase 2
MGTAYSRRVWVKMAALTALVGGPFSSLLRYEAVKAKGMGSGPGSPDPDGEPPLVLWYRNPASEWIQALALGNGRLGAMVFGETAAERIGLNEDTLWSGGPYDPAVQVDPTVLREIRRLMFEGRNQEAQHMAEALQGQPRFQSSYQTVGELQINFPGHDTVSDYRRELNLDDAMVSITYKVGGVTFKREMFSSPADQVIAVYLSADQPGQITLDTTMTSPQQHRVEITSQQHILKTIPQRDLVMSGHNGDMRKNGIVGGKGVLTFQAQMRVSAQGGTVSDQGDKISVTGADSVLLLIAAATSYKNYRDVSGDPAALCNDYLRRVNDKNYAHLRRDHIVAHQGLFKRVRLDLGTSDAVKQPTDERIRNFAGKNDPALIALYYQFGRYLLISCSRPGSQPANLQGLWNKDLEASWGGKYTVNINTEMNYWPTYTTNLFECDEPLLMMVADLSKTGVRTAKVIYNARGWVCHHNTDLWRATAPIDGPFYGQWPCGGAWLCNALFQRYLFDGDKERLSGLYPIMKGAALFFMDTLVEEPGHGWLVTNPSMSPEHEWTKGVTACVGPTMDLQIIYELFSNVAHAAQDLGTDADFASQCLRTRDRLAPLQIGKAGQLQEWLEDIDLEAPEIAHRHMSPLYGLFPGSEITPDRPELFAAARKLTEMRNQSGMGWAGAWRINLWARLLDPEKAYRFVAQMLTVRTEGNMFDKPSVQLDGNFGATSGITEMLLQSHNREIHLLPALPAAWPAGSVKGLRARGGFEIMHMEWADGKLARVTIRSTLGGHCRIRVPNVLKTGGNTSLTPVDTPLKITGTLVYDIPTQKNKEYILIA